MEIITELTIDGPTLGVIYSLIAVTYSLAYGAGRSRIFAGGAVYLIGVTVSLGVISASGVDRLSSEPLSLSISLIAAVASGLLIGWAISRGAHSPFAGYSAAHPPRACLAGAEGRRQVHAAKSILSRRRRCHVQLCQNRDF